MAMCAAICKWKLAHLGWYFDAAGSAVMYVGHCNLRLALKSEHQICWLHVWCWGCRNGSKLYTWWLYADSQALNKQCCIASSALDGFPEHRRSMHGSRLKANRAELVSVPCHIFVWDVSFGRNDVIVKDFPQTRRARCRCGKKHERNNPERQAVHKQEIDVIQHVQEGYMQHLSTKKWYHKYMTHVRYHHGVILFLHRCSSGYSHCSCRTQTHVDHRVWNHTWVN